MLDFSNDFSQQAPLNMQESLKGALKNLQNVFEKRSSSTKILTLKKKSPLKQRELRRRLLVTLPLTLQKRVNDIFANQCDTLSAMTQQNLVAEHMHIKQTLSLKNFTTLKDSNWINDEIVNAYASLLNRCDGTQALTLNTYVYNDLVRRGGCDYAKVKRILVKNKVDLNSSKVLLPVNQNNIHWLFLLLDFNKRHITVFDSLEETSAEYLDDICAPVSYALNKICEGKLFSYKKANFPCQENEDDCGVFMLLGLRSLALALPTRFSQMDIAQARQLIAGELLLGELILSQTELE